VRRFNFTGRKKILRSDVDIHLRQNSKGINVFDVSIDLIDYEFPPEAIIYLEPQRQVRLMRIELGIVKDTLNGTLKKFGLELLEFEDIEGLNFRIKVVEKETGLLYGNAEQIKVRNESDKNAPKQRSILPVRSMDLSGTGEFWRIDMDDNEAILEVDISLGSREQVVRHPVFKGLILPSAMRLILTKILNDNDWDAELSDPNDFETMWLTFAKEIGAGQPTIGEQLANQLWLDDAVRIITNRINVRDEVIEFFGGKF